MSDRVFFVLQGCLKYVPFNWAVSLRAVIYAPFFKSFGKNIIIHDNVLFKYPSDISIGNNAHFGSGSVIVGKGGLTIGSDVLVGHGSKIVTTRHNFERTDISIRQQGISSSPISIGNDVWLGFNVVILDGSKIGDGCILAAGAIVKGVFERRSILAGVPAKILRPRES